MAKRKKQASLSAELFEVFAAIVKVMLAAMVEVIKFAVQVIAWFVPNLFKGLWAVLRGIGRGIAWIARKNAEESRQLNEVRRAKLEAARAWRYETADEVEEEDEVTDEAVLPLLPEAVEELPPIEFRFIGSADEVEAVEAEDDGADEWVLSTMPWDTVDKARKVLERRLKALEDRRAKAEWVNKVDEVTWTRYQNTKAWRGLLWEINHTQAQLEMLGAD